LEGLCKPTGSGGGSRANGKKLPEDTADVAALISPEAVEKQGTSSLSAAALYEQLPRSVKFGSRNGGSEAAEVAELWHPVAAAEAPETESENEMAAAPLVIWRRVFLQWPVFWKTLVTTHSSCVSYLYAFYQVVEIEFLNKRYNLNHRNLINFQLTNSWK
jgi:hypothetical protein